MRCVISSLMLAVALIVSGCSTADEAEATGGVSQSEADALNAAAEMLDEQQAQTAPSAQ